MDLDEAFEKFQDEFLRFERIETPPHPCPDVSAFIRLNELAPVKPGCDMVSNAQHDEIFLATDCEALALLATDDDVIFLARCGVRWSPDHECLCMFA